MKLTGKYKVIEITRETSARLFRDVKVGDTLEFELEISHVGGNRGRSYAPDIKIILGEEFTICTMNQLANNMSAFSLVSLEKE